MQTFNPPTVGPPTFDYPPAQWPPPAPPKKSNGWKWIGAIVAGLAVIALIGGHASSSTGTTSSDTSVATSSGTGQTITEWANANAGDFTAIVADTTAASNAAEATSFPALGRACASLERDVTTAQGHLPMPLAAANGPYTAALGYYIQAAQHCQVAAATYDVGEMSLTTHYLGLATTSIESATAAIQNN